MSLPILYLKSQADRRLKLGHLWIFSNEVDITRSPLKSFALGEQVVVQSLQGKNLGVALINPNALICARLISKDSKQLLDAQLLERRFTQALALRELCFNEPYYRLIYGDSDFLPGLVVDRFADYLVVQIANAGMENVKELIVNALVAVVKPKGVLLANEHSARSLENLSEYTEIAYGKFPNEVELIENNTRFIAPVLSGQKTGWFYDHRINRAQLQHYAKGKRVLDVFSYIGGWGIEAAQAGATQVICVDASEKALAAVNENAKLNNLQNVVSTIHGKAIDVLKQLIADDEIFDIVVLDPPAFIKRRKDQKSGEAAYRHINELGMKLLGADGILVAGSCSMHLAKQTLIDIVQQAGHHLNKQVQIIAQGGQGPDHPIHPSILETDYLKAVFARVYVG